MHNSLDNSIGCFLGLAIGDALGTTFEFSPRPAVSPEVEMTGGGPFQLPPGGWTDDTSMALALSASINTGKWDLKDQASRYVDWYRNGTYSHNGKCFDIGMQTLKALQDFQEGTNTFEIDPSSHKEGNGSVMRIAPVAIRWQHDQKEARRRGSSSSRVTHNSPGCCVYTSRYAGLLAAAIRGSSKEPLELVATKDFHSEDWMKYTQFNAPNSGWIRDTINSALWAFFTTDSFYDGAQKACGIGGDSDTIGAVYGQLAGAYYGASGIPDRWKEALLWKDKIADEAMKLHALSTKDSQNV